MSFQSYLFFFSFSSSLPSQLLAQPSILCLKTSGLVVSLRPPSLLHRGQSTVSQSDCSFGTYITNENKSADIWAEIQVWHWNVNDERSSDRGGSEQWSDLGRGWWKSSDTGAQPLARATGRTCQFFHSWYFRTGPGSLFIIFFKLHFVN